MSIPYPWEVPKRPRPTLITLGSALRQFRKDRGLSQDRLANHAGVDRAYVGGIERAERHPTWEVIERLLEVMDVSWRQFGHALDQNARQCGRSRSAKRSR